MGAGFQYIIGKRRSVVRCEPNIVLCHLFDEVLELMQNSCRSAFRACRVTCTEARNVPLNY